MRFNQLLISPVLLMRLAGRGGLGRQCSFEALLMRPLDSTLMSGSRPCGAFSGSRKARHKNQMLQKLRPQALPCMFIDPSTPPSSQAGGAIHCHSFQWPIGCQRGPSPRRWSGSRRETWAKAEWQEGRNTSTGDCGASSIKTEWRRVRVGSGRPQSTPKGGRPSDPRMLCTLTTASHCH